MAISSGVGPHRAWLSAGGMWPIEHGHAEQTSLKQTGTFHVGIPMGYPGAESAFGSIAAMQASVIVETRGASGTLLTGELDSCQFNYIQRMILVAGRDASAPLHANKSNEKWTNKTGLQIVQDLAGRVGLGVSSDVASKLMAGKLLEQDYVRLSDNVSFAFVIHKCAELDGCRWFVKGNTLYYLSKGNAGGMYSVNYVRPTPESFERGDFIDLTIVRNLQAQKQISVNVSSWHPKDKKTYSATATAGGSVGEKLQYNYDLAGLKKEHVQQYALTRAQEHARHGITVHADLVGDPNIDINMGLQLSGTGWADGPYTMDNIAHEFGMHGHRMRITARLPDESTGATVGEKVQSTAP
jgi:hypothetical protein